MWKDSTDNTKFDEKNPSDLGDIVHFYANQWEPVLGYDSTDTSCGSTVGATTGCYYVKYLKYKQGKCM